MLRCSQPKHCCKSQQAGAPHGLPGQARSGPAVTNEKSFSRRGYAPELCPLPRTKDRFAPGNQREAKRRKAHANHSPRSINKRCRLLIPRARLRAISGRSRLPALRPRLSQGLPSLLNSRPCFLGLEIKRALPALSCPSAVAAPHASAVVPKGMMPEAAPARVARPYARYLLSTRRRSISAFKPLKLHAEIAIMSACQSSLYRPHLLVKTLPRSG